MKNCFLLAASALLLMVGAASCCNNNSNEASMNKDFMELAAARYSVRHFTDSLVREDDLDKIIQAGRIAPTAVNSQPQKIYVAKSPEAMAKLNKLSPCIYGAPHCFIFCYNDATVCKRGENGNYGDIDVTIVLTHMMLEAANLGIGTCIVGYFDKEELKREMGLPEGIHPVLLMPFGYAAEDAVPSPRHSEFRPVEETVETI